jgi:hypothetical protein
LKEQTLCINDFFPANNVCEEVLEDFLRI